MSTVKVAVQHSQKDGRRKTSKAMSAEVSPDSKCPICLDVFHNISYLDRCLHKFCFRCILEWSKNKPECPLCKQPFKSIYHSIKSDQDFQKYDLKQQVENNSFGYFEGVRFRYRTTLTGLHRQMRRTSPPPDNGVMFEASTDTTQAYQDRYIRRMMTRLAAKRRAASEGRAVNSVREQEMINFRRELYRRGVRVRDVRDGGRSRDTSAEFYRRNPACLHRLIPWLKRELMVLYGAHGSLVNIVQHIIMSRITRYDMADGAIHEELRPFLQARTEHFLHEFISFAKSPFNMEAYDQHAVYDCPAPSSNEDSSSNSSVIAISEDEENSADFELPGNSASTLSHSVWDDETPGPSYSTTAEPSGTDHLSVLDLDSENSSEDESRQVCASPRQQQERTQGVHGDFVSSDSEDCVIVGFVKATAERTPELVQLSSDSSDSSVEENKEVSVQSQHIRFPSCSPAASQSSHSRRARHSKSKNGETHSRRRSNSKERSSSSASSRCKTAKRSKPERVEKENKSKGRFKSKDKDYRRRKRSSQSREDRHPSPSPAVSYASYSPHSPETVHSHYSRRNSSKCDRMHERRDSDHSFQSYTHYRRERNGSVTQYTQRQSFSYRRYSRSFSRSPSRDSRRRDRRWSRSRSSSSSQSPSTERRSHHDKPGGKRKYKARHLEEPSAGVDPNASADSDSKSLSRHKKKSKEKRRKKSKERSKKVGLSSAVELVSKDHERHKHHHKKKKKHKKKSKRHKSCERRANRSTNVITIDSDSCHTDADNGSIRNASEFATDYQDITAPEDC